MKLFFAYLKSKMTTVVLFGVFALIFAFAFLLYRLPLQAVIYPAVLCLVIGVCAVIIDFSKVKKRHDTLETLRAMTSQIEDELPLSDKICERDLGEILLALKRENDAERSATGEKYLEMLDYYTMWAHQIKTPIASMKLSLQNEDSALSRKLSRDLFRIEQYVEMVLAYLRLGSDSSDYVFKNHALDALIKTSVKKFAPDFIGKKLTLNYSGTDKTVLTDEKWLSFVIEQLLSNALKYTKEGEISIYVEEPLTLCISDTGIGIAESDLPRIFDKGYTGFNGRSEKSSSGIGLYLCRKVCRNLGTKIEVTSKVGVGTTVKLDLSKKSRAND